MDVNGQTDYIELALVIDMLRMFTPTTGAAKAEVSSYSLKHTAEKLLDPHCSYVSNGRLIWAAAVLGLDLIEQDGGSPNLLVGISEREHHYVRQMVDAGGTPPRGHQHRPPGCPTCRKRSPGAKPVNWPHRAGSVPSRRRWWRRSTTG